MVPLSGVEFSSTVPPWRSTIERTIDDLKVAKEGDDTARIKQLTEQLQQASYAIGQQMYAQQAATEQCHEFHVSSSVVSARSR